jgi:hypothetical protein
MFGMFGVGLSRRAGTETPDRSLPRLALWRSGPVAAGRLPMAHYSPSHSIMIFLYASRASS